MAGTETAGPRPLYAGSFADPFVLRVGERYYAYGTGLGGRGGRAFEVLSSPDLVHWTSHGGALETPPGSGGDYWAPEVAEHEGRFYMYYSVGQGDVGHQLRVAVAEGPLGPFRDLGLNLAPDEPFAIDPHPFRDEDGQWYLYYARDLLDGERPGTALAVQRLEDMTRLTGEPVTVLRARHDWQRYQKDRPIYGGVHDWHTLEGPFVVRREGKYHLFYSGGAWTGEGYGVGHAVADHPLGPWRESEGRASVLHTGLGGLRGPGHNSLVMGPDGRDWLVYHAWDEAHSQRQLHVTPLRWEGGLPRLALEDDKLSP